MLMAHPPTIIDYKKQEKKSMKNETNQRTIKEQSETVMEEMVSSKSDTAQDLIKYSTVESASDGGYALQLSQPSPLKNYTKITFEPDLQRFGFVPYDNNSR